MIAYIIPDINNLIFSRVARGVQDVMVDASYDVTLYNTDFSDKKGAYEATCNLIKRKHRHIVFLGVKRSITSHLREQGYKKALSENDLPEKKRSNS